LACWRGTRRAAGLFWLLPALLLEPLLCFLIDDQTRRNHPDMQGSSFDLVPQNYLDQLLMVFYLDLYHHLLHLALAGLF